MQTDRSGRLSLTFKIVLGMGAGLAVGLLPTGLESPVGSKTSW